MATAKKKTTITKKMAAQALCKMAHGYHEKVSFATVYKKCFFDRRYDTWRYLGKAYDYSLDEKQILRYIK